MRTKSAKYVHFGGRIETALAIAFNNLAQSAGVSGREALRRCMVQAVMEGRLPGIQAMDIEAMERQKWGNGVTPVYDGESTPKTAKTPEAVE